MVNDDHLFLQYSAIFPTMPYFFALLTVLLIASPWSLWLWFNFMFSVHIHRNLKIPKRFLLNRGGTDNTMAKSKKKRIKGQIMYMYIYKKNILYKRRGNQELTIHRHSLFIGLGVTRRGLEHTTYRTRWEHTHHYIKIDEI